MPVLAFVSRNTRKCFSRVFHPGHPCCLNVVGWGWRVMRGEPGSDMGKRDFSWRSQQALSVREFQEIQGVLECGAAKKNHI